MFPETLGSQNGRQRGVAVSPHEHAKVPGAWGEPQLCAREAELQQGVASLSGQVLLLKPLQLAPCSPLSCQLLLGIHFGLHRPLVPLCSW